MDVVIPSDAKHSRVEKQRSLVRSALTTVYDHQLLAAQNAFSGLKGKTRAVILAAEMQSGKSGVSLAIASLQRLSLSDEDIVSQQLLKDSLYIMTMADVSLLAQAREDLKLAGNLVVSNLTHFERDIEKIFVHQAPKLIIVDECHYGSGDKAIRYEKLFDYIEKVNTGCKVVFISATPLSALLATEGESIISRQIKTKLVFHRTSDEYYGVRKMLANDQVHPLDGKARNFLNASSERKAFIDTLVNCEQPGWALVRVPSGAAMDAKDMLARHGLSRHNIHIIGQSLVGVPQEDLVDIDEFRQRYEEAIQFDEKIVAITVAGFRAGINFGHDMKRSLIATWDSTISNVAAVVQANIGRACGYHSNQKAVHYTNRHAVSAYGEVLDYLESHCTTTATDDIAGLREKYESICRKYLVRGLDAGATVTSAGRTPSSLKKIDDVYLVDSYLLVPAQLANATADFADYTEDGELLDSIQAIRSTFLTKDGQPEVKTSRQLRGAKWMTANWVNGDTYDNREKAMVHGTYQERLLKIKAALDDERGYPFNDTVVVGGGVASADKTVSAFIFSTYNESRRVGATQKRMTQEQLDDLASWFNVPNDDTFLFLVKRGEFSRELTDERINAALKKATNSSIYEHNHFLQK
ncbi:DEAD/DEAH box helicase family protein [Pseudomonas sp. LB3P93]